MATVYLAEELKHRTLVAEVSETRLEFVRGPDSHAGRAVGIFRADRKALQARSASCSGEA